MKKLVPLLFTGLFGYFAYKSYNSAHAQTKIAVSIPITPEIDRKIWDIIGQYESARNYGAINESEGSYGYLQSYLGASLYELIALYVSMGGQYAQQLQPYLQKLSERSRSLIFDYTFYDLLRRAGNDPVMHKAQWDFFHERYLNPAYQLAMSYGWKLPISYLALANSYIHNGDAGTKKYLNSFKHTGNEADDLRTYLQIEMNDLAKRGKETVRVQKFAEALDHNPYLVDPFVVRNTPISGYGQRAFAPGQQSFLLPVVHDVYPAQIPAAYPQSLWQLQHEVMNPACVYGDMSGYHGCFGPYGVVGSDANFIQDPNTGQLAPVSRMGM